MSVRHREGPSAVRATAASVRSKWDADNLMAAKIIVADPVKYAGGCLEWARLVLGRLEREQQAGAGKKEARTI